jgi:phage FluMu protein gp41
MSEIQASALHTLTLVDGLPVQSEGKLIKYRTVHLRETTVADERWAQRQAERVVVVGGAHKLLVSDADFRFAMTARHIDAFECDGQRIGQAVIDLELLGKLSAHDLGLIEQRIFLLTLAAEVRYGHITQAQFDALAGGAPDDQAAAPPQSLGQVAELGAAAHQPEPGPALLADYAGSDAHGAPARPGR